MSVRSNPRNAIQLLAPPTLTAALKEAAAREMTTTSEYTRRALIEKLRADGIDLARPASPAAAVTATV
jgi:hypothetical protein